MKTMRLNEALRIIAEFEAWHRQREDTSGRVSVTDEDQYVTSYDSSYSRTLLRAYLEERRILTFELHARRN